MGKHERQLIKEVGELHGKQSTAMQKLLIVRINRLQKEEKEDKVKICLFSRSLDAIGCCITLEDKEKDIDTDMGTALMQYRQARKDMIDFYRDSLYEIARKEKNIPSKAKYLKSV